jgi:hypothetical protein
MPHDRKRCQLTNGNATNSQHIETNSQSTSSSFINNISGTVRKTTNADAGYLFWQQNGLKSTQVNDILTINRSVICK